MSTAEQTGTSGRRGEVPRRGFDPGPLLSAKLREAAKSAVLLVGCDFDGTLAQIAPEPALAHIERESLVAVQALSEMPRTHVAVISGRALSDLARLMGTGPKVHLVGSHGSEFDPGFAAALPRELTALRERLIAEAYGLAARYPGAFIEVKPAGAAIHYRLMDPDPAARMLKELRAWVAGTQGVQSKHGKKVVELSVVEMNKGKGLKAIRQRVAAGAVVFIGDDHTDEDAFALLSGPDAGIKVGPGPTRAEFRIHDPADVSRVLATLAELRGAWLMGAEAVPIERHSMLSDQRTVALVDPHGRIVWMCVPRIDAPPLFSELVGGAAGGSFQVAPAGAGKNTAEQEYDGESMVLRTRWPGLMVTDYLDCCAGRPFQRAGRTDLVRVIEGTVEAVVRFSPRLDFGRTVTHLAAREGGLEVEGGPEPIVLFSPGVEWRIVEDGRHHTAEATVRPSGEPVVLELRCGAGTLRPSPVPEAERRKVSRQFWAGWAGTLRVPRLYEREVRRSAVVLKALCYGPSGAIAAAATTSLPEHIGGVRNWDYRYCWPRDAAMAASALARVGNTGHAMKLLDWMVGVVDDAESPDRLRPLYTVTGRTLGPEGEIGELSGYAGSRPVRVGNAAAGQVQLDVFGPIAELVAMLVEAGAPVSGEHWRLVQAMATAVQARWQEPDHGIWEIRSARRHHVHSRLMCWHTLDRALLVADHYLGKTRPEWAALRDTIKSDILEHGFRKSVNAFTTAYDSDDADAAALLIGLCGLLPPDDPRLIGTVEYVQRALQEGPTVYRYRFDDGLPGGEGGFHICLSWLIECLWLIGRRDEARRLLDELVKLVGPTGLLSEQYEPRAGRALGNHPQAYSHLGLINAVVRVSGK